MFFLSAKKIPHLYKNKKNRYFYFYKLVFYLIFNFIYFCRIS
ncbi:hypothetical protein M8044_000440 [Columbia Basin potato purple top phytoplasma]|uniref:Uncharacterized protein n=1 Tax=Columbia Basin potato purple top phytoplasma TaxID=307134 RepID=A0ABT5L9N4_9MOLU|nr:hypothetical protein [Columbia Basin potato purple top phytoplasma]